MSPVLFGGVHSFLAFLRAMWTHGKEGELLGHYSGPGVLPPGRSVQSDQNELKPVRMTRMK
jgi:hypothetical protein